MAPARHTKKEIAAAIDYALEMGWTLTKAAGQAHIWGTLRCPRRGRDGCTRFIHSTPRVPHDHADQIRRAVDRCPHREADDEDESGEG